MSSTFHFEGARVVQAPELCYKFVAGSEKPYADVLLEVRLPADRAGNSQLSIVEVEAWMKMAGEATKLGTGDVVSASGWVSGRSYVDRYGRQRYAVRLRLKGLTVQRKGERYEGGEELGF
ncbi:MAG: hypothetical protein IKJ58_02265 [Akkermansia sp.]|nr:hypothetical protein [Akkermansia sp.]